MINKGIALTAALLAAFFLPIFNAVSQEAGCYTQESFDKKLKIIQEIPKWRGLSKRGHVTVIYENPENKAWTAVVFLPDGRICLADVGTFSEIIIGGYDERS